MTKQEVKDEFKQTEGNPEIKGRIRRIQRQMALSRMMQKVPQADVIVRNPTHYAVALKYDPSHHGAPVVLAKGQDCKGWGGKRGLYHGEQTSCKGLIRLL